MMLLSSIMIHYVSGTCCNVQRCLEDNVEEDNVVSGRSVEGLKGLSGKGRFVLGTK